MEISEEKKPTIFFLSGFPPRYYRAVIIRYSVGIAFIQPIPGNRFVADDCII